ncbi:MAG: urea carboxylase-associated family protein, partial [Nocardioidaceae bacterium]
MTPITLAARTGRAFRLGVGDSIAIVNLFGQQVVDTWAVSAVDPATVLSMAHTRMANGRLAVQAGDALVGSDREPMLTLESDTSEGHHDTLIPACDPARY